MDINFQQYTEVKFSDAALRNAVRLDCVELVQRAIAKGGDVNCRYAEDWNTPLHLAIIYHCQSPVINELMSHKVDYGLVNGENVTASELALRKNSRELGRALIVKEFECVDEPMDAIYEMLKRNSVEALEVLIEVLCLSGCALAECLSKAWNKIEIMNVVMNPELKVFVHMTLIRLNYSWSIGSKSEASSQKLQTETQEPMKLMITEISILEEKYDTGLCHDITDEFLEMLRLILKHMFLVKNRVDKFPAIQLEYCIAMYLAIFDRKPELDLYQLVINKRLLIEFLKQFKAWHINPWNDQRMSCELLHTLINVIFENEAEKSMRVVEKMMDIVEQKYTKKELIIIRNKILKSHSISKIKNTSLNEVSNANRVLFRVESDSINNMFEYRKSKKLYKKLGKTYFKLKQMYSLQKSIHYLSVIESIELNPARSCYIEMLTIQRVIQVLGETLKSTKLSPNITTNLRSVLEFVSPGKLLKWISKLRQYFSHNYSATKHTLYRRLRVNDPELIDFFKRVKADLLKVVPLLGNIFTDHVYRLFKGFLGYVLTLESVEHVRSCAKASRVRLGFKLDHDFQSSDLVEIKKQLANLEQQFDPACHSSSLEVIAKIHCRIDVYVNFLKSRSINCMTEMVLSCIGELLLCDRLDYQKNVAHFYLHSSSSPKTGGYGAATFLMQSCNPLIRELLTMEARIPDENSLKRTTMIQNLLKLANVRDIQQLHELTLVNEKSLSNISKGICNALVDGFVSDNHFKELDKLLQKYYANLFAIDDKYRIVKTFCKSKKLMFKVEAAAKCRKMDKQECENVLSDLITDVTDILSLPESMDVSDLVSLVACCEVYQTDKIELFALETVLLEVLEILSSQGVLTDNRYMMASYRPVVSGRNLRNYLAHDGLVYETVCRNRSPILTLLLNASCLTRYSDVQLYSSRTSVAIPLVSVTAADEWSRMQIDLKSKTFHNIQNDSIDLLISTDTELHSRDHSDRTVLMSLIDHYSEQFIYFLLGRTSKVKSLVEEIIRRGLNQEHNFYDDDEFTMAKLISQKSIRENISFYLALKHHHFELENELDRLCGGAYNEDSLHMAILFQNEKSAMSIIDDSRLYSFCKHDAWNFRNTILTLAVLHKLPNVVRRICEASPELIERTNTSQETPLRIAVATTCAENVKILLEFGAQVFTKYKPPIINAVQIRKDELLDMMLPSNDELLHNETLLNQLIVNACSSNHTEMLERLLPMVKSRPTLIQSLHSAVSNKHLKATRMLVDYDASIVNELNEFDSTALFWACYCGHDAIAKLLLERGADCAIPRQSSPLQCAIDSNKYNQFKMMLQRHITDSELRNKLFQDLFDLSKYKWIWTVVRAGLPCNLTTTQSVVRRVLDDPTLDFLFNLIRFRKELVQHIDTHTLANAVLLKNYKFVKFVLERNDSCFDRTRLLNCAVKANDKEMVNLLIAAGCSVNSADAYGITPLATAVSVGKPDMVKVLVKFHADPNLASMGNCSWLLEAWNLLSDNIFDQLGGEYYKTYPLVLAAMHSFGKIAEYLLKAGSKADVRDQSGFTPLVVAMSHGDTDLVDALIHQGASVEYCRSFSHSLFKDGSALHYTAIYGHSEMAKRMVEVYHFDHMAKDSNGNTALHLAIFNGQANFVQYFLDNESLWDQPNNSGDTPLLLCLKHLNLTILQLIKSKGKCKETFRKFRGAEHRSLLHMAVLNGSTDILQLLLREFDIDCCLMDQLGHTALYYAVLKKNLEIVKLLMDAGSSLTGPCQYPSMPPFVLAVLTNQLDVVQLYIEKEKDAILQLREHSSDGRNLLIASIMQNNFAMCRLLLNCIQFDLNAAYENGWTAIHLAATKNSVRTVDFLIQHGCNIDQTNQNGKTALILAIERGNCHVAHYLLGKGAAMQIAVDYRFSESNGMNLLHHVASTGKLNSVKFLVNRGFFTRTSTDENGRTIGHYAASNKQHTIIEFLISSEFPLDQLDNEGRSSLICALENEDIQLAKRLKSVGSSLDVVQLYINRHNFLMKVLNNKNLDLIKFLTDECCITICSSVANVLIAMAKAVENTSVPSNDTDKSETSGLQKPTISPIIQHILDGNMEYVKLLIEDSSTLEEVRSYRMPTRDQETLLHVAARKGHYCILRLLLEKGIFEVDVGDYDQTTPLQEAAMSGHKECVELLLQHGANINFVDLQNTTALTRACVNSQKQVAELLFDLGADPDNTRDFCVETRDGATALHIAVYGDLGLVELMIKMGISVNDVDACGRTALHTAALMGSIQATETLLKLGACADMVDNDRRTPFVTALLSGHEEEAERLLAVTQDIDQLRDFRMAESLKSVLHIALDKGFVQLIILLINNYGLDSCCTDSEGKSILHYAVADGNELLIRELKIDLGMLCLEDNTGETPISICLNQANLEIYALLIEPLSISGTLNCLVSYIKKASNQTYTRFVNLFSRWLLTFKKNFITENQSFASIVSRVYDVDPLLYALHGDHRDLLELFLESGIDRSLLRDATWLHVAALKNLPFLAKIMIDELEIDVDSIDDYGKTPLCYAVFIPQTETAKLLLDRGANVNFQDSHKRTPLQTALESNNSEMVRLLLEHHADIVVLQEFRYFNDNEHLVQHYIVERGLTDMLLLILPKIDVMSGDKFGMTPLHYAAGCNQLEMIRILVNASAEVDCFDVHKTTPLMRAISRNHLEAYHLLVGFGANTDLVRQFRNDDFDGETILHITAEKNRIEATTFLVEELGCDVDCIDKYGNTPLHCAIQKGSFEVVKYLLGKNANLHLKNNNDQTALHLLEETNFNVIDTDKT